MTIRRVFVHVGLLCTLGTSIAQAQTLSRADATWSGEAVCVLSTRGPNYQEDQTHTWRLTGGEPRRTGDVRHWPAVWSVQGSGSSPENRWTINVPEISAPIGIWEIPGVRGNNRLRIALQRGALVARAITVRSSTGRDTTYSLQEWQFPSSEDMATADTLVGSRTRAITQPQAWQKPPDAVTTETCKWNFTRVTPDQSTTLQLGTGGRAERPALPSSTGVGVTGATGRNAPTATGGTTVVSNGVNANILSSQIADLSTTVVASDERGAPAVSWPWPGTARYSVSVTNRGPAAVIGATLVVPANSGLSKTIASCSATGGAQCPAAITASQLESGVSIPNMASGGTVTISFFANLRTNSGSVSVTGTVSAPPGVPDPSPGNNSSTQTQSVTPVSPIGATDLTTRINWTPWFVTSWVPNSTASYVVTVNNNGPASATGATLAVPQGQGLSKTTVTCTAHAGAQCPAGLTVAQLENGIAIPSLPFGGAVSVSFEATVTAALGTSVTVDSVVNPPTGLREYYPADNTRSTTHSIQPPSAESVGRGGTIAPGGITPGAVTPGGRQPVLTTLGPCLLPGPMVSIASVSPAHVHLTWVPISGASYGVSRADLGPVQGRTYDFLGVEVPGTAFLHWTPLYVGKAYQYTVTAEYGRGCGSTQVSVAPPPPYVPTASVVFNSGVKGSPTFGVAGTLRPPLDADAGAVWRTTGFLVLGPGLPPNGLEMQPDGEQLSYWRCDSLKWSVACQYESWSRSIRTELWWSTFVPAGEHTWLVVPFFDTDNGRMSDIRYGARVTLKTP